MPEADRSLRPHWQLPALPRWLLSTSQQLLCSLKLPAAKWAQLSPAHSMLPSAVLCPTEFSAAVMSSFPDDGKLPCWWLLDFASACSQKPAGAQS